MGSARGCVFVKLFVLACFSILGKEEALAQYSPTEIVRIDCGSANGTTTVDGVGTFGSDNDTNVVKQGFSIDDSNDFMETNMSDGLKKLLKSARVFTEPSTYIIPTQAPGSHWLRLYFDYRCLESSTLYNENIVEQNPKFSVTAGQSNESGAGSYTILNNLNPKVQSLINGNSPLLYEYYLNIQFSELFLTFTPTPASSFAYINAIELVSAPQDLNEVIKGVIPSNGLTFNTYVPADYSNSSLQTMYRLNVGGADIDRANDSSLSRAWTNDTSYLLSFEGGTLTEEVAATKINYQLSGVPQYFAPSSIYASARVSNVHSVYSNLTWFFQVDPHSNYLVRLHFCEIMFSAPGDRIFDIFMNGALSYKGFDILRIANGPNVPVFLDFSVALNGDFTIEIDLGQVSNSDSRMDSILNGLEIFKVIELNLSATALPLMDSAPNTPTGNAGPARNRFSIVCIMVLVMLITIGLANY